MVAVWRRFASSLLSASILIAFIVQLKILAPPRAKSRARGSAFIGSFLSLPVGALRRAAGRLVVAGASQVVMDRAGDLLIHAKHLFVAATGSGPKLRRVKILRPLAAMRAKPLSLRRVYHPKVLFNSRRCFCWRVVGTSATATISTSAAGSVIASTYGLLDTSPRPDRRNHYDGGSAPVHGRPSKLRSNAASAIKPAGSQKDAGRKSQRERTLLPACYHQRNGRAHDGRHRCLACQPFSCRRPAGWY